MAKLPDLEALAIFAKVAEFRSFAAAATDLRLSKATVSKAIARLEQRLGARLIVRTARRFALTDAGRQLVGRATQILADGEAAESITSAETRSPRGAVRLAAPLSFGVSYIAPLLPEFLRAFPDISIDLHLNDAQVDLIGEGFDAAIRIAVHPGASVVVRQLCEMPRYLVASPAYLKEHERPTHPLHLAQHRCISYSYAMTSEVWRFTKGKKSASVRPSGPLRVNNGDAMMPALVGGAGVGILPEFFLREALETKLLERLLPDWSIPLGAVYWITPPEGPIPKRVEVLGDYLIAKLSHDPMTAAIPRQSKRRRSPVRKGVRR
ncbi:LysR family transcriptional regulator [Terricaulis silvestris]|uniref:D-malate degradation protein R n=1 Tax=Terricaulis silvestris TaxID=2686094 RepID=A0A6I6MGE5_9CAUL|nr:LysR family transcriptional regulator [Terricaulis silvestris]QGZ93725.1 D-malate degradation protein R [Terricaulis silvestris]